MALSPSQAIAKANGITSGYGGMCLMFCRVAYGVPNGTYPSAAAAWAASPTRHDTGNLNGIPVGAPIYFAQNGNPYGHVAIYLGNGLMRTTNSADNRIHTDPVSKWQGWGYRLLGWTEDIDGAHINGLTASGGSLSGTYRVNVDALNVRDRPTTSGVIVAQYKRGQTVNLDGWSTNADGYSWGRYTGASSGKLRYIAIGTADGRNPYLVR